MRKKLKIKVDKLDLKNFQINSSKMEPDNFWKDLYNPNIKNEKKCLNVR